MATYTPTYTEETPSAPATTGAITGKVSKAIDTMAWMASVTASINQLFFKISLSKKGATILPQAISWANRFVANHSMQAQPCNRAGGPITLQSSHPSKKFGTCPSPTPSDCCE